MSGHDESTARFVRESLGLAAEVPIATEGIVRGGSDRTFARCRTAGLTFVLMQYGVEREENALYVPIARFLQGIGIRVPEIVAHDPVRRLVLTEDLGERDLWSFRDESWDVRSALYKNVLAMAVRLHAFPLEKFPGTDVHLMPAFGPDLYRWERDYFREQFVEGVCGVSMAPVFAGALEEDLRALAERIMRTPPCLIHRDLQSQNVMIAGDEPAWIDFQGMRPGSPFYDVASLLYDPYVSFTEEERLELLRAYADGIAFGLVWPDFVARTREAAVHRLMQALGAYGFLGFTQGKRTFLAHIPRALDYLELAAAEIPALSHLQELIAQCRRALPLPFVAQEMTKRG